MIISSSDENHHESSQNMEFMVKLPMKIPSSNPRVPPGGKNCLATWEVRPPSR